MPDDIRVARPPPKPLLVFDGDCGFCRRWIARWQRATGDRVEYAPFQDAAITAQFPEIPSADFEKAVRLILPDGSVFGGAEAVFGSMAQAGRERWLLRCYRNISLFAAVADALYAKVAARREFLSKLDRFFLGSEIAPRNYVWVRFFFLRGLAVVYLIAFASLWVQIQGLMGSHGIVPVHALMSYVKQNDTIQKAGLGRFRLLPTLAWWSDSDRALNWQCAAGVGLSALLFFGIAPAPVLFLLWLIYLSLASVGPPFLNFQWDILLQETGLLAIFFAPLQLVERPFRQPPPSRLVIWLLRWLLFRLMFESGCVKLMSGDEMWRNLTALTVHYETQPLPTWIGWYAHQLPVWAQKGSALVMFFVELAVPWLIFAGRRARRIAAGAFVALQMAILLTGNYGFFNLLTILLCILLLDDSSLAGIIPRRFRGPPEVSFAARWPWQITAPFFAFVIILTSITLPLSGAVLQAFPRPLVNLYVWLEPFRSFNGYGLFATMTHPRNEIIVEGSNDGLTWATYEFKYKPGDPSRKPAFVAPYQPRLDWQMWFAALGNVEGNQWFLRFEFQLLNNSPPVVALLARNPFPNTPPRYIRATLYEYHFTDIATRRSTGQWWSRELKGDYVPPLSLADFAPGK